MRSFWKIAVLVLCVALICAAAIAWQSDKAHANQAKLAEDARTRSKRAEQGDATAQAELANIYYQGQGVPQNYGEALRWYRKAADQGNGEGQFGVGAIYYHGQGVPQNYGEALRWYRKAADQGNGECQFGVGAIYYHGQGVQQDYTEALRWYRKAADQGYAKAQYNLGYMYWYGQGLPQNRAEAVNWFRKAADQGDLYALRALSRQPSTFTKSVLLGELLGGIWLVYFVSFTAQVSATSPRNARQKAIAA